MSVAFLRDYRASDMLARLVKACADYDRANRAAYYAGQAACDENATPRQHRTAAQCRWHAAGLARYSLRLRDELATLG